MNDPGPAAGEARMTHVGEPRKGKGVPRETRAQNSIADLQHTLVGHLPNVSWDGLPAELEQAGFFDAGMQQQVRIMAQVSLATLGSGDDGRALVAALSSSRAEKVRGVAAFAVPIAHPDDLREQLEGIRSTGALEGTWPRELSATVLHELIIEHGVSRILPLVRDWIEAPEPAVRRLVVEAFRPRGVMLAHIQELKRDPTPLLSILEPLLDDGSGYVRKAVANNMNDVSRDNPESVLSWAGQWSGPDISSEREWILRRGLRTLVNDGHPRALQLQGYAPGASLRVVWRDTLPQRVEINEPLRFEFEITNPALDDARVLILLEIDAPGKGAARRRSRYRIWHGIVPASGSKAAGRTVHFADKSRQLKEPGIYRLIATVNGMHLEDREMVFERSVATPAGDGT
jgi:3-methyladenine DNA glycosylase AlkC